MLAAIAIPIFCSQFEKASEATDMANIRAAYAEVASSAFTISKVEIEGKRKKKHHSSELFQEWCFCLPKIPFGTIGYAGKKL